MKIILTGAASYTKHSQYVGDREARLAFAEGFARLGHEVYFFEEVGPGHSVDEEERSVPFATWDGRRVFADAMRTYGLLERSSLIYDAGAATFGLDWASCMAVAREARLLITVGGRFRNAEIMEAVEHRAYVDINPAKTQAYAFEYGADYGLERFDSHFSVGLSVGLPECPLPTGGLSWKPLFCPVVLERWRPTRPAGSSFSTITSWGRKHRFFLGDRMSGDKMEEWMRFIDLPNRTSESLSLALPLDRVPDDDLDTITRSGWRVVDARDVRTPPEYVDFVSRSKGEFSVANGRYVRFGTGWVSDRTARYLAAGRPALVQDTGIGRHLPVGEGLLTFSTAEEAVEGLERIDKDHERHCRRAAELAREYFDSDKVLSGLLSATGVA